MRTNLYTRIGLMFVLSAGLANVSRAELVRFLFDFRAGTTTSIGSGFYQFDEITPSTNASFASLTNFSWAFDVPSLGLSLASVRGDLPSSDSLVTEGITLSGSPGSRSLRFFDSVLINIFHTDVSEPFPTGINFRDGQNIAEYFNPTLVGTGTFSAVEVPIPEPSIAVWGGVAALAYSFKRRKRLCDGKVIVRRFLKVQLSPHTAQQTSAAPFQLRETVPSLAE